MKCNDQFIQISPKIVKEDFCHYVIDLIDKAEALGFGASRQESEEAPHVSKQDTAIYLPSQAMELPVDVVNKEAFAYFKEILWDTCYKEYANKFGVLDSLGKHSSYYAKIQKTRPGQGYHIWHCEHGSRDTSERLLTWTVYLNDDFDAGETEFLYQNYRYTPQQGDLVIFPASYTHTHRGNPPIGGNKYIMTGWIEFE